MVSRYYALLRHRELPLLEARSEEKKFRIFPPYLQCISRIRHQIVGIVIATHFQQLCLYLWGCDTSQKLLIDLFALRRAPITIVCAPLQQLFESRALASSDTTISRRWLTKKWKRQLLIVAFQLLLSLVEDFSEYSSFWKLIVPSKWGRVSRRRRDMTSSHVLIEQLQMISLEQLDEFEVHHWLK